MQRIRKASFLFLLVLSPALFAQAPQALALHGDYEFTHDPSIAREGGTYYVFATGHATGGGQFAVRTISPNGSCAAISSMRFRSGFARPVHRQRSYGRLTSPTSTENSISTTPIQPSV
jgi:hypothetical protein